MARTDTPRIAVLGAGPIGLEAALYARGLNLPVTVFERSRIGDGEPEVAFSSRLIT